MMPIKFRCRHCQQFLGISRSQADTLTDCPSCGRTIRVPRLDGKVRALPKPSLNMRDSQLVKALGMLANIGEDAELKDESSQDSVPTHEHEELSDHGFDAETFRAPVPEPVTVEPRAQVVAEPVVGEGQGSVDHLEVLKQIVATPEVPPQPKSQGQIGIGLWGLGCSLCLLFGGLLGRWLFPIHTVTEVVQKPAVPAPVEEVVEADIPAGPHLTGTVTYVAETGEQRPDQGSRVLILPIERVGTAKIAGNGFRVGSNSFDQALLTAEIRSLGGDFVMAGATGRFDLLVDKPGRYGILIASRYDARPSAEIPAGAIRDHLAEYFQNVDQLVGKVKYHYRTLTVDDTTTAIEQHFTRD